MNTELDKGMVEKQLSNYDDRIKRANRKGLDHYPRTKLLPDIEHLLQAARIANATIADLSEQLDTLHGDMKVDHNVFSYCPDCGNEPSCLHHEMDTVIYCVSCDKRLVVFNDKFHDFAERREGPAIDHPDHYNTGKIEVIDFIEDKKLAFNDGNAVKYIARAQYKGNYVEDLKKARWYLTREIARFEPEPPEDLEAKSESEEE